MGISLCYLKLVKVKAWYDAEGVLKREVKCVYFLSFMKDLIFCKICGILLLLYIAMLNIYMHVFANMRAKPTPPTTSVCLVFTLLQLHSSVLVQLWYVPDQHLIH